MHEQTIARRKSRFKLAACVSCVKGAGLVIRKLLQIEKPRSKVFH